MPEGPEVRIVATAIQKGLPAIFEGTEVIENVPGKLHRYSRKKPDNWNIISHNRFEMIRARTKGKLILLDIKTLHDHKEWTLLITLGMEADFRWNAAGHKHTRFAFIKERGDLSFVDQRCFGTLRICTPEEAREIENTKGWDLLNAPMPKDLWRQLQNKKRICNKPVKPFLLTQDIVSGVGNIYAVEALYLSKIHPATLLKDIPQQKWETLNAHCHKVMYDALRANGTSVISFTADGHSGAGQHLLRVYMKKRCPKGHPVSKIKQGRGSNERTSWFCQDCQPKYPLQEKALDTRSASTKIAECNTQNSNI